MICAHLGLSTISCLYRGCLHIRGGLYEMGVPLHLAVPVVSEENGILHEPIRRELHGFGEFLAVLVKYEHVHVHIPDQSANMCSREHMRVKSFASLPSASPLEICPPALV